MSTVRIPCAEPDCGRMFYADGDADTAECTHCGTEVDLNESRRERRRGEPEDVAEVTTRQRRPRG